VALGFRPPLRSTRRVISSWCSHSSSRFVLIGACADADGWQSHCGACAHLRPLREGVKVCISACACARVQVCRRESVNVCERVRARMYRCVRVCCPCVLTMSTQVSPIYSANRPENLDELRASPSPATPPSPGLSPPPPPPPPSSPPPPFSPS
jgi:hypothetical protein